MSEKTKNNIYLKSLENIRKQKSNTSYFKILENYSWKTEEHIFQNFRECQKTKSCIYFKFLDIIFQNYRELKSEDRE